MSIADFKAENQIDQIEIKRNGNSGKCFFTYGFETGACSRKVVAGELTDPVISRVVSADSGEMFMLLHQKGEGGATTIASL
jgi:hypothetical protein